MNWSRGFFRVWILITVLWVLVTLVFSWKEIADPWTFESAFLFSGDPSSRPTSFKMYSDDYDAALKRKAAGELVEVEISQDTVFEKAVVFHPVKWSEQELNTGVKTHIPWFGEIIRGEKAKARRNNALLALFWGLIPPLLLLLFGVVVRWVAVGFRVKGDA